MWNVVKPFTFFQEEPLLREARNSRYSLHGKPAWKTSTTLHFCREVRGCSFCIWCQCSLEITCCWWQNGCITFKLYHPLKGPDRDDISILEKGMSLSLCLRQNRKVSRKRVNPQGILKGWRQFLESCPTAGREVYSSNIVCELPQPNEDKL